MKKDFSKSNIDENEMTTTKDFSIETNVAKSFVIKKNDERKNKKNR